MEKRKRHSITIQQKLNILREIERGTRIKALCFEYNVNKSTISKIVKNKENLEAYVASCCNVPKKKNRMTISKFPEMEHALYMWFLQQRDLKNIVTNEILKLKGMEIYVQMGLTGTFLASDGWVNNFKKRHGIRLLTISGEKLSCDASQIPSFLEKFKDIINKNQYGMEQIYNCDETGLVYKGLPNKTNVHRNELTAPGRKNRKERVTLMPCVNATGNHKLPLMMIGKASRPRCFKNATIPLYYRSSKNAWQTTNLFEEWFLEQFIPEVTSYLTSKKLPIKALLIVDNATCHGTIENEHFKILFLPPNMTPYLQPLDQNIIKSLKVRYRKHLLTSVASQFEDINIALNNITLKDVAYMAVQSWNEVPQTVIVNAFKLYSSSEDTNFTLPIGHFTEDDDIPIVRLFNSIIRENAATDDEIMEWAEGENELSHVHELDSIMNINPMEHVEGNLDESNNDQIFDIDNVINSFNLIIEWSDSVCLPINDVLLLRKIREKAVIQKFQ